MKKLRTILTRIYHIKALKYILVTVVAVMLIGFVDENSVWNHHKNMQYIDELKSEIKRYSEQYRHDQVQIHHIDSDPKAIEKIARERYFMKADDEDIFVLSDDKRQTDIWNDETAE